MNEPNAVIRFALPDEVNLTLTITLPLSAWKSIRGKHAADYRFSQALDALIEKAHLEIDGEVAP